MALGGGTFTTQNKTLPGTYINFVSAARASASVSDRGYAAMPMLLNWGPENQVITVTNEDFIKNSLKIFGYAYDADELKGLRDLFTNATTLYTYRLNGGGTKASNAFGTAKYSGALGNSICNVVSVDDYLTDTLIADDYEHGDYNKDYTFDSYFSLAIKDNGDSGAHIVKINIIPRTIGGKSFNNCIDTQGAINTYNSGSSVSRALKLSVPYDCTLTMYVSCSPENDGKNAVIWDENLNQIHDEPVLHDGNAFDIDLKAGTYYIGGEEGGIYIYQASFISYAYNVKTIFNGEEVEEQDVYDITELVSDYIDYNSNAILYETAGLYMTGGTDVTSASASAHQKALNALESYSFNTLGCISADDTIKKLYAEYTKRLRDESGIKFQCVVYDYAADYEGVINVVNSVKDGESGSEIVYWVTGASAGCAVNKSLANTTYNGEYDVYTDYTQTELAALLKAGKFVLHRQNDEVRVLMDINSFVSVTKDKNEDFSSNQVIRVLDQIGNDIAVLFNNNYYGKVPNDDAGRSALKSDIAKHHQTLQTLRAIEGFSSDDITVAQGDTKNSVVVTDYVTPVSAMTHLYMTVIVQ